MAHVSTLHRLRAMTDDGLVHIVIGDVGIEGDRSEDVAGVLGCRVWFNDRDDPKTTYNNEQTIEVDRLPDDSLVTCIRCMGFRYWEPGRPLR